METAMDILQRFALGDQEAFEVLFRRHRGEKFEFHVVANSQPAQTGRTRRAGEGLGACARLCHAAGGELEQIQFLLGHVSIQTTERYLGCKQRIRSAVNDRIGIETKGE
jgi:integrase